VVAQLIQVSSEIWCIRRLSYLTCSYIVNSRAGVVLVDAGMDSTGGDMLEALRGLSFSLDQVKAVLLTHWHNDHAAGAKVLKEISGAATYYHELEAPFLTRRTAHTGLRGYFAGCVPELGPLVLLKGLLGEASPVAVEASYFVEDGNTILSDFEVIATPGHTAGHVSFYYHPQKALFAGDALAVINGTVHFMSRPVTLDTETARKSVVKCLQRKIDLLCPGHREVLIKDTQVKCQRLADYAATSKPWPLFG
jgi:glyoxylase-like metal-dependent hydrolase (beta-lactamase superfamily II)